MADKDVVRASGYNGSVEFDGKSVTIIRDNWRGKAGHGKADRLVDTSDIQRVDFELPSFRYKGYIRFAVPGQTAPRPENDRHCVLFTKKQTDEFSALRDAVKVKLSARPPADQQRLVDRAAEYSREAPQSFPVTAPLMARYEGFQASGDAFDIPQNKGGGVKTLNGAQAEFESGADTSRPTLTRIGAGALLAGPIGAVGGALLKKNTSKCYVTVVFQDGDSVIIDAPIKDEMKLRQFAADVNRLAAG